jgi:hypothetical protein
MHHRVLLVLLIVITAGCSKTPPEEAIHANIKAARQAIVDRNAGDAVEVLAEDFVGNDRWDKQELRRFLTGAFLRHKNINVVITRMDVEIDPGDPKSATMQGTAVATGARNILPQDGRIFKLDGEWRHTDGDWRLVRLKWE